MGNIYKGQKFTLTMTVKEGGQAANLSTTTARKVYFVRGNGMPILVKDAVLIDGGTTGIMRATVEASENTTVADWRAQGRIYWPDGSDTPTSVTGFPVLRPEWN